ncbi:MAG: AI-2E family transporter [Oscillibacter sp.]
MREKNRYIKVGVTVFLTAASILLFYDTLFGNRVVIVFGRQLLIAMQPIIYGALIAYLLAPVVNFFEERLFANLTAKARREGRQRHLGARSVSMLLTWLLVSIFGYLLASVLLPELYKSLLQLVGNIETYYITITGWADRLLELNPGLEDWVGRQMDAYYGDLVTWLTSEVIPQAQQVMSVVSGGVFAALIFVKDLVVGIIVSVYLLATKERCAAITRKMAYGLFSQRNIPWVLRGTRKADNIFSGFVRGKLLDSLIIGILCFIGCSLLKFPYTPLVSVIVGVTNVIPFFGPFLGAIPSLFLILLADPIKALYFLLFVLALQQLDGNVIGPKILGDKTGLSSLWVIIAILVGGHFFGLVGMFFGVPVCACLYCLITFLVEVRLRKKNLPLSVDAYASSQPVEAPTEALTEDPPAEKE